MYACSPRPPNALEAILGIEWSVRAQELPNHEVRHEGDCSRSFHFAVVVLHAGTLKESFQNNQCIHVSSVAPKHIPL